LKILKYSDVDFLEYPDVDFLEYSDVDLWYRLMLCTTTQSVYEEAWRTSTRYGSSSSITQGFSKFCV
jgi:hypothetical protein